MTEERDTRPPGHPDLNTPLGRAWMTAAGLSTRGGWATMPDEAFRREVIALARAVKVLCEVVELNDHQNREAHSRFAWRR